MDSSNGKQTEGLRSRSGGSQQVVGAWRAVSDFSAQQLRQMPHFGGIGSEEHLWCGAWCLTAVGVMLAALSTFC